MKRNLSALAHELKQTRPFRTPAQEATVAILRTADGIVRAWNRFFEPHGITRQQYNVLRILRGARDPLATLDIADRLIEQTPAITQLIDRLEAKGLLARERSQTDRRQVLVAITETGLALLADLDEPVDSLDDAAVANLTAAETRSLIELLAKVRNQFA